MPNLPGQSLTSYFCCSLIEGGKKWEDMERLKITNTSISSRHKSLKKLVTRTISEPHELTSERGIWSQPKIIQMIRTYHSRRSNWWNIHPRVQISLNWSDWISIVITLRVILLTPVVLWSDGSQTRLSDTWVKDVPDDMYISWYCTKLLKCVVVDGMYHEYAVKGFKRPILGHSK